MLHDNTYLYIIIYMVFLILFYIGQSEVYENGSSGDTCDEDMMFEAPNPRKSEISVQQGRPNSYEDKEYHSLWSNSSR